MSRGLVLFALLAACGGRKEDPAKKQAPPPIAAPGDGGVSCAPGQVIGERGCVVATGLDGRAALVAAGTRLDDAATLLRQVAPVATAAEAVEALHGTARWRALTAARPQVRPVDVAALRAAPGRLATLSRELAYAAGDLRGLHGKLAAIAQAPGGMTMVELRATISVHMSSIFGPRGAAIGTATREVFTPLAEPLAAELALAQAEVCAQPDAGARAACDRLGEVRAASEYLARAAAATRQAFDGAAAEVTAGLGPLLDDAARSSIDRATAAAAAAAPAR